MTPSDHSKLLVILTSMHEYQSKNNTSGNCITNTQIFYNLIKKKFPHLKIEVMAAIGYEKVDNVIFRCISGHLIVMVENFLVETSYEYSDKIEYNLNLASFLSYEGMNMTTQKELIKDFLQFSKYALEINNNNFHKSYKGHYNKNKDYYNNQLDFIIESII